MKKTILGLLAILPLGASACHTGMSLADVEGTPFALITLLFES